MDAALALISHWLPLVQGFAALASIGGAIASWKYARKAQRAREEMTRNIIASRVEESFSKCLSYLRELRASAVGDNKTDYAAYQQHEQNSKHILEDTLATAKAADLYLNGKISTWPQTLEALASASGKPDAFKVDSAIKFLALTIEQIKLAAVTREIAPHEEGCRVEHRRAQRGWELPADSLWRA